MLLFSDFDDTLRIWNKPDQFADNLAAIKKFREAGNQFCLATGRSLRSVAKRFPDYADYCDYLTLDNGGVCVNTSGKVIFLYDIAIDVVRRMTEDLSKITASMTPVYYYDFDMHQELAKPPTKIRYWVKDNDLATKLTAEINRNYDFRTYTYQNIQSEVSWIPEEQIGDYIAYSEVMSSEAGKETAVAKLASILNLPHSEIITVGDDWNDLKMLQEFNGYIIADSKPEILSHFAPTRVTSSVAELINNLLK